MFVLPGAIHVCRWVAERFPGDLCIISFPRSPPSLCSSLLHFFHFHFSSSTGLNNNEQHNVCSCRSTSRESTLSRSHRLRSFQEPWATSIRKSGCGVFSSWDWTVPQLQTRHEELVTLPVTQPGPTGNSRTHSKPGRRPAETRKQNSRTTSPSRTSATTAPTRWPSSWQWQSSRSRRSSRSAAQRSWASGR